MLFMKRAQYITIEGVEGVGKTTQTKLLVETLRSKGYKVLETKEPGSEHSPLTMILRKIMLDNQYDSQMTVPAREFLSQAIRSVHLERVIVPALYEYDFIIQDRGILSGYAYGHACGNELHNLYTMTLQNLNSADNNKGIFSLVPEHIYDSVIYLKGNPSKNRDRALTSKQEFETGDAMESRGNSFIENVSLNMDQMSNRFNSVRIDVDGRTIEQVHEEIMNSLGLGK